jgi:hypothetical protein
MTGSPECRQTVVSEQTSTIQSPSPYQLGRATRREGVSSSASTSARVGRRALGRRSADSPSRRGGAGSYRAASRRNRVTQVTPCRTKMAKSSGAANPLLATRIRARSGSQRRACKTNCRAQPISFLWHLPCSRQYRSEGAKAVRSGSAQSSLAQEMRDPEHQAEPAQAAGLDEVALRGTDRTAVDALGRDAHAAPAFDRVVEAEDTEPFGTKASSRILATDVPMQDRSRRHGLGRDGS